MQSSRQERSERKRSPLLEPCFVSYLQPGKPLGAKRGLHPTEALQRGAAAATARAHLSAPGPCRSLPGWRTKGEVFLWGGSCCHEPMDEMGFWWKNERLSCTAQHHWRCEVFSCDCSLVFCSTQLVWLRAYNIAVQNKKKKAEASICLGAPLLFVWIHCMH